PHDLRLRAVPHLRAGGDAGGAGGRAHAALHGPPPARPRHRRGPGRAAALPHGPRDRRRDRPPDLRRPRMGPLPDLARVELPGRLHGSRGGGRLGDRRRPGLRARVRGRHDARGDFRGRPRARFQLPGARDGRSDRHPVLRDRRPRRPRVRTGRSPRWPLPRRRGGADRRLLPGSEQGRHLPGRLGSPRVPRGAPGTAAGILREDRVTGRGRATGQSTAATVRSVALLVALLLVLGLAPVLWLGSDYKLDVARRAFYAACLTGTWSLLAGVA